MASSILLPTRSLLSIHPGEWHFGADYEFLHTVLGSCVGLVAWHPRLKVGGLCHYLLPSVPLSKREQMRDCRYAVNALPQMKKSMLDYAAIAEFRVSLFGGGDMFSFNNPRSIGAANIHYAQMWLEREKISLHNIDIGGSISRSIMFSTRSGEVILKRYSMNPQQHL